MKPKIVYTGFALLFLLSLGILIQQAVHFTRLEGFESRQGTATDSGLIERLITRNEGVRRSVYVDSRGNRTVGIGHKLKHGETYDKPLNDAEIDALLSIDLKTKETHCRGIFGDLWDVLNEARQAVIVDMMFNLGTEGFLGFHETIKAIKKKDWDTASREILNSKAARENPVRYHRNAKVMRTGESRYFEL